jgi:hypothetical protein
MTTTTVNDEVRAQVVRQWMRSPLKQTEFCAERAISTRVLREWVRRFGPGERPEARALSIIDEAVEKLLALRAALDAEKACRVGTDYHEVERRAEPELVPGGESPPSPAPAPAPRPMPMPRAFW